MAGARTASGQAILSNDPHLAPPSRRSSPRSACTAGPSTATCPFDVTGFSLASVPGVVIGKNATIAWGLTTSYVDVQDLYLEQVQGDTVRVGDDYVPLQVITEEIRVRGEDEPRTIRIRSSRHGPLLSDVDRRCGGRRGPPEPSQDAVRGRAELGRR